MIRRNLSNIALAILLLTVISLIVWRQQTFGKTIPEMLLGKPVRDVIVVKSKISGKLVSAQEIEIKSSISGIIDQLFIDVGDSVITGTPIARVKPASEPEELENARKQLQTTEIQFELERKNYDRKIGLEAKGGISKSDLEQTKGKMEITELEMKAAQKKLRLLLEGYLEKDRPQDNLIVSTSNGIVLDLPIKEGQSITKRNTYNEGTTIAKVADMKQLLFKGQLSEYEINKIKPGMPLSFLIGAFNNLRCKGQVLRIAPQAKAGQDPVKFDFEANVDFQTDSLQVKTGLTVVAEFITEKTDSVLCLEEKYLHYSNDSVYVVIVAQTGNQEKRVVEPGLSDGTKTEIKKGLTTEDRLIPVDWK